MLRISCDTQAVCFFPFSFVITKKTRLFFLTISISHGIPQTCLGLLGYNITNLSKSHAVTYYNIAVSVCE